MLGVLGQGYEGAMALASLLIGFLKIHRKCDLKQARQDVKVKLTTTASYFFFFFDSNSILCSVTKGICFLPNLTGHQLKNR